MNIAQLKSRLLLRMLQHLRDRVETLREVHHIRDVLVFEHRPLVPSSQHLTRSRIFLICRPFKVVRENSLFPFLFILGCHCDDLGTVLVVLVEVILTRAQSYQRSLTRNHRPCVAAIR